MPLPLSSLEKHYEFEQARMMTLSKGSFSLAGLILTPLLAAIVRGDQALTARTAALFVGGIVFAYVAGWWFHLLALDVEKEFDVAAAQHEAAGIDGPVI